MRMYLSNVLTIFYLKQQSGLANNVVVYYIIFEFPGKNDVCVTVHL